MSPSLDPPPNVNESLQHEEARETHIESSRLDPLGGEGENLVAGVDGWAYGPPATVVRESNFISDENLLLWLAQKQDGLYGELRDHMDLSRERSKLMADLNHLSDAVKSDTSRAAIAENINALLDAYADTPFGDELKEMFTPLLDELHLEGGDMDSTGENVEAITSAIKSKGDELGRDDQLELIEIQSLTADIREAGQLASNLLASSNQTANAIVGNIAR